MENQIPDLEAELARIQARLFDLLPLTKKYYCHPEMRVSYQKNYDVIMFRKTFRADFKL